MWRDSSAISGGQQVLANVNLWMSESYNSCIFAKRGNCGPYTARKETCISELSKLKNDVSTSIKALNVRLTFSVLSGNCVLQEC